MSNIIVPYVTEKRKQLQLGESHPALLIFDTFLDRVESLFQMPWRIKVWWSKYLESAWTDFNPFGFVSEQTRKDFLHSKYSTWCATWYRKSFDAGKDSSEIRVDMSMAVIKEVSATWLTGLHDHLFHKAGVTDAIQSAPDQVQPREDFLLTLKMKTCM